MFNPEGCAKGINGFAVRIDLEIDVARLVLRLDHTINLILCGVWMALERIAGRIRKDLDGIFTSAPNLLRASVMETECSLLISLGAEVCPTERS